MFKPKTRLKNIGNSIKSATLSDLSQGLTPEDFVLHPVADYGVNGKVISTAFDPIQSLLALGTELGTIHVWGQKNVQVVLSNHLTDPIINLKFVKNVFLVATTYSANLLVYSLDSKNLIFSQQLPSNVTSIATDPSLDFVFIGLDNGLVLVFDVTKGFLTRYKIPHLQKINKPNNRNSYRENVDNSVKSLQIHPRDIGILLIAYSKTVVLYSLTENKIKQSFNYIIPGGAPGGDLVDVGNSRQPTVIKAVFHPNGLNILTCHEDGSLVFWDTNNGTLIQARTLFETDVDKPQSSLFNNPGSVTPMKTTNFIDIKWICSANPEVTSLLLGDSMNNNLTLIVFDMTPKYSITSYEKMSEFYSNHKTLKIFPITNESKIKSFLPLPQSSPFFDGNHDPNVVLVLLESGFIEVLRFPYGKLIYSSKIFPSSFSWINSKITFFTSDLTPRNQWIGILETLNSERKKKIQRQNGKLEFYDDTILQGGSAMISNTRSFNEGRSIFITGHQDGSVELWDASRSELDETNVIEIDTNFGFDRVTNPSGVSKVSYSGYTTDLIVSNMDGETILYKFGNNRSYDPELTQDKYDFDSNLIKRKKNYKGDNNLIVNVEHNVPSYINKGFLPSIMIKPPSQVKLTVTALKNSNIEFACIAYNDGQLILIDRRVNDIIFLQNINEYTSKRKHTGSLSYVTSIEFSIMKTSEDAKYSSILLLLGTSVGSLIVFQILPGPVSSSSKSRFNCKIFDVIDADNSKIRNIIPINLDTGNSAIAKAAEFAQLSAGILIKGLVLTVSSNGVKLFKSLNGKSSSIHYNADSHSGELLSADLSILHKNNQNMLVLITLFGNNSIKVLSIPSLGEITSLFLKEKISRTFSTQSRILLNGDVLVRKSETQGSLIHLTRFGANIGEIKNVRADGDLLFNQECKIPARPAINSLQWVRGSKIVSLNDLVLNFEGERRPKSKYEKEELLANESVNVGGIVDQFAVSRTSTHDSEIQGNGYNNKYGGSTSTVSHNNNYNNNNHNYSNNNNKGWGFDMSNIAKSLNQTMDGIENKFTEVSNQIGDQYQETSGDVKNSMMKNLVKSKFGF